MKILFDAHFPAHTQSYRGFRFGWVGTHAHPPAFALQLAAGGGGTVYASWNGATRVASWRVLAGNSPGTLKSVGTYAAQGFETAIRAPTTAHYIEVQALSSTGAVMRASRVVKT